MTLWIGGSEFTISIEDFKRLANREYDNSFGSPKVAQDLKIVGKDWWLERAFFGSMTCFFRRSEKKIWTDMIFSKGSV